MEIRNIPLSPHIIRFEDTLYYVDGDSVNFGTKAGGIEIRSLSEHQN
jgi:hypothetical protein